jgi:hypothetical protein
MSLSFGEPREGAPEFCQRAKPACQVITQNDRRVGPVM